MLMAGKQRAPALDTEGSHQTDALSSALKALEARRKVPTSAYRLQLHRDFTFRQAHEILPYLERLGITDCYTSPVLKAAPGSVHGYDICDHRQLNPELGSPMDYD